MVLVATDMNHEGLHLLANFLIEGGTLIISKFEEILSCVFVSDGFCTNADTEYPRSPNALSILYPRAEPPPIEGGIDPQITSNLRFLIISKSRFTIDCNSHHPSSDGATKQRRE